MTVKTTKSRAGPYAGDGVQTTFVYDFITYDEKDLYVYLTDKNGADLLQVLGVDYTVSGIGNKEGGNVFMTVAPEIGESLTIVRVVPLTQPTSFSNQGAWFPEVHERSFDELTMMVQQLSLARELALSHPVTDPEGLSYEVPNAETRSYDGTYYYPSWDENGNVIVNEGMPGPQGEPGAPGGGLNALVEDPLPTLHPTCPGLNMNGKPLIDGGGAQLIGFSSSATPVNSLQVLNADAGNRAVVRAIGEVEAQLGLASQGAQRVWARRADGLYYPLITDLDAPFVLQGYVINTAGGTLEWRPLGGGRVWINSKGNVEFGTVSASITPVAWTLYYVYGYLSGGTTPALEITTTGPATISDPPGIYFKSGDSSRTLLAVARANGSGQFEFSTQNQMIRNMSGFPPIVTRARGNDGYDVSSTGLTLISTATLRTDVVLAPGDVLVVRAEGVMNSPYGYVLFCGPTIDTASASHTGGTVGTLAGGWTGETYSGISGVAWLKASGWQYHTGYLQAMVTGSTGRIGSEHIGAAEAPTLTAEVHPNGY